MRLLNTLALLSLALLPHLTSAQQRPYIGFAYPAGARQGATLLLKIGGQSLDDPTGVIISGAGVSGRVVQSDRALNNQEANLLTEQLRELKRGKKGPATEMMADTMMVSSDAMAAGSPSGFGFGDTNARPQDIAARIEKRLAHYVNRPASAALAHIVYVELAVSPDAKPGQRELWLQTVRGISNPVFFHVGQLPEDTRPALPTSPVSVLGKEQNALRRRPAKDVERKIEIPCTLNGQIASGEVNRYRFHANKGQKLVVNTLARQLVPFIADAVPGWFQPVVRLLDNSGEELAYDDDYKFRPDPVILCEIPKDGDYLLEVYDAIYRGREDFVYRITVGEVPFITSIFPLGAKADSPAGVNLEGWNLDPNNRLPLIEQEQAGMCRVVTLNKGVLSNPRPFELGDLPEIMEQEGNDTIAKPQQLTLPVVANGRIDKKDDVDVFRIQCKSNSTIVAEVRARRLESPLDSVLKITDASGRLVAFNDDKEDVFAGANTHDADSYIRCQVPSNGVYYVQISDVARNFGSDFAYRLRLSSVRPDFALRAVPSSISLRGKSSATVSVHIDREDGFTGPVKISLKDPPAGFSATPVSIVGTQTVARLGIKTTLREADEPFDLKIIGTASIDGAEVVREAVPAEDRMQAFFWRHLVPASSLKVLVGGSTREHLAKRTPPELPASQAQPTTVSREKPKFTRQQVSGRMRQLRYLYEQALLTDDFYLRKLAECEAARNQ